MRCSKCEKILPEHKLLDHTHCDHHTCLQCVGKEIEHHKDLNQRTFIPQTYEYKCRTCGKGANDTILGYCVMFGVSI